MSRKRCYKETVDLESGECEEQTYYFDDESKTQVWKPFENFIKVFPKELKSFKNKLRATDLFIIIDLLPFISYKSGMLTKSGKNDTRCPLMAKDIVEILEKV